MNSLISSSRRIIVWALVMLAAFCVSARAGADKPKPLPAVRVMTLAGDTLALREICRGQPAFIFFWATWCKACSRDMPEVFALEKEFGQAVKIFGVSWQDSAQAIKAYFSRKGYAPATYIDVDGSVFQAFGFKQIPSAAIISASGEVVFAGPGSLRKFRTLLLKQMKQN